MPQVHMDVAIEEDSLIPALDASVVGRKNGVVGSDEMKIPTAAIGRQAAGSLSQPVPRGEQQLDSAGASADDDQASRLAAGWGRAPGQLFPTTEERVDRFDWQRKAVGA